MFDFSDKLEKLIPVSAKPKLYSVTDGLWIENFYSIEGLLKFLFDYTEFPFPISSADMVLFIQLFNGEISGFDFDVKTESGTKGFLISYGEVNE